MVNLELTRMFMLRQWRLAAIVAVVSGGLACFLVVLFPGMSPETVASISAAWPPLIRELFGDPLEGFASVYGWLNMQFFHIAYWVIFAGLLSIMAVRIVAWEVEHKTLDVLLSYPTSRKAIVLSRAFALAILSVMCLVPVIACCAAGILLNGESVALAALFAVSFNGMLLSLSCASLALAISIVWPSQLLAVVSAMAIYGMLFALKYLIVPVQPRLYWSNIANPFQYYASADIMGQGRSCVLDCMALSAMCLGLLMISCVMFERKDVVA